MYTNSYLINRTAQTLVEFMKSNVTHAIWHIWDSQVDP